MPAAFRAAGNVYPNRWYSVSTRETVRSETSMPSIFNSP